MDAEAQFDQIIEDLAPQGVLPGALFGARSLTIDGTAFACFKNDQLAVRLGADSVAYAETIELDGAGMFDPSGKGRPFKDWVAVPPSHAAEWSRLAAAGLESVA